MTTPVTSLGSIDQLASALGDLARTIDDRVGGDPKRSYTASLLAQGSLVCAKKLGEEGVETALAVASQETYQLTAEAADLLYHLLVALRSRGATLDEVALHLHRRSSQSGLEEKAGRSITSST
jgi:phosphoribosyl-ATP pyrophosphohydrolase